MTPHEWLFSGDTGLSSECIWRTMMGIPEPDGRRRGRYPLGPSDFGRCWRLLTAFPEWRGRLSEMAQHGSAWAALVERWDAISDLYIQAVVSREKSWGKRKATPEERACYELIQKCIGRRVPA